MKHITLEDRQILEELLEKKISKRKIALKLGKVHSSILGEIKNNSQNNGIYNAIKAQKKSLFRKNNKNKRSKIEISPGLKQYILDKIRILQWSPEQISGKLKIQSGGKSVISHETIYKFIYSKEGRKLKLYKYLRRKKKAVRQAFFSRKKRVIIKEKISIHRRHNFINDRSEFGHWETDLMIFSKEKFVLAVTVERLTRFTIATILPNKTALEMKKALYRVILDSGQKNVKSITFDNGTENALHHELRREFPGFETYFCDAFASWQKGAVENMNGLIRQYLPRNCVLGNFSQHQVDEIVFKINHRPKKSLKFFSSAFLFNYYS